MTRPVSAPASAAAIRIVSALLEARSGQRIEPGRVWRIEAALKPLLKANALDTLDTLVARIGRPEGEALADAVVESLLNQETSFFRDAAVIDQVALVIEAMRGASPDRRLRIWSAGCSTGQEPLSIAIMLADAIGIDHPLFPEIHASDVSALALARARSGRYNAFEIQRGLPIRQMIGWFEPEANDWVAKRDLLNRISFRRANLAEDAPPPGRFDLILCRNVLLYFPAQLRREVFDRMAASLRPDGLFVLGAGETVIGQTEALVPSQVWRGLYCRVDAPEAMGEQARSRLG